MIDYCTIIVDKRELELLPLHLNSLKHYCGDVFNIKISVPPDPEIVSIIREKYLVEVWPQDTYVQANPSKGIRQAGFDCSNRLDKLLQVSSSKWVILSHLDIVYKGPMLQSISAFMDDSHGMIGFWPHGVVAVNLEAYRNCHYGFWPITGMRALKLEDDYVRLYGPFSGGEKLFGVVGVDVGDLLRMEMHCYGYKCVMGPELFYDHIGGQSYRAIHGRPEELETERAVEEQKQRALEIFGRYR